MVPRSLFLAVLLGLAPPVSAGSPEERYDLVRSLMAEARAERRQAAGKLLKARDLSLVPGMVDALFFTPLKLREELLEVLEGLTGEKPGKGYHDWVELVGRRQDLAPGPGYPEWKSELLSRIDPTYREILYPGAPSRIRLEEIVWGGVRVDGIPPLEDPPRVPAAEAGLLTDGERVFGVAVGGAHHAYPLRYLSWHEMANDVVGGEPLTVSF